jgi:hypothetical protein
MKKLLLILLLASILPVSAKTITATSWLVANEQGQIIQSENAYEVRSIASISKLMTVMIVLDADQNPNTQIKGYSRQDHIMMALIKSDNNSAALLCDNYPGGKNSCVRAMNEKAAKLNMTDTKFVEATGLSVFNTSTARDLINLAQAASRYPAIVEASKTSSIKIRTKKRWFVAHNTNPIIGKNHKFLVSKTGYIRASGGCIVMMIETELGRRIVVVLGSKNTRTRIAEAEFIANSY